MPSPGKVGEDSRATTGPVIVFAGPCLPRELDDRWRRALDGFDVRPPAQRGDVLRALGQRPRAILLLDGLYYSVPSITHKELLYALDSGVPLIGAGSMGALRAAEMAAFGMVGLGQVFESFHSGELDGDDEVAMLHGLPEHGYRAVTLAFVEVRHALRTTLEARGLPESDGGAFIRAAKALPFTERTPVRLKALLEEHAPTLGTGGADAVLTAVMEKGLKGQDALLALEWLQRELGSGSLASRSAGGLREERRGGAPLVTTLFSHFREWYLGPASEDDREAPSFLNGWQMAQLFHPRAPEFFLALRRRFLLATAADAAGLSPSSELRNRVHADLEGRLDDCPLPVLELDAEVHISALARTAETAFAADGHDPLARAGELVAPRFGLRNGDQILELMTVQGDLLPPWFLARSFLFTEARTPALRLAASALQVARAFSALTRGSRLCATEVDRLACDLFSCTPDRVPAEARRRGLQILAAAEDRAAPGSLADAVALVAAAERLPRPANDYPDRRRRLRGASLTLA
ncbi:MAG: TfuA domain-containing protein [Acidobacteriota bacterium]